MKKQWIKPEVKEQKISEVTKQANRWGPGGNPYPPGHYKS